MPDTYRQGGYRPGLSGVDTRAALERARPDEELNPSGLPGRFLSLAQVLQPMRGVSVASHKLPGRELTSWIRVIRRLQPHEHPCCRKQECEGRRR
jgi:hypothetical protein